MDFLADSWSFGVILLSAFIIGWAAETAQTFIPRALALSLLAWLQTLPEFAVEAAIAWQQKQDLMIANLTGSLRLLVGLGLPAIFFAQFFFQGIRRRRIIKEVELDSCDFLGVIFLFVSVLYFLVILAKGSLSSADSVVLFLIYAVYLYLGAKLPVDESEDFDDLPWIGKKLVRLAPAARNGGVVFLFALGGLGLWLSVHPFLHTMEKWSVGLGISTFVFVQWFSPILSEFPEYLTSLNWGRQEGKVGMGIMNTVNSNINQWTMLAGMIPLVFSLSLGHFQPVLFDSLHRTELALTIAQSALAGLLLLDMKFSIWEASLVFILWGAQAFVPHWREEVALVYVAWVSVELIRVIWRYVKSRQVPQAFTYFGKFIQSKSLIS